MMSSIIENRMARTIIVLLMIGTMILPVPLFKNIYITPLMIRIAMADTTPPYIDHTPVMKSKAGESIQITATIEDESDVNEVWLFYMKGKYSSYQRVKMNKTDGKSNQFDAVIPLKDVVPERILYFIEARDNFGNTSQAGSQSNPFTVKVEGPLPRPHIIHTPITKSYANESIEIKAKIENQDIVQSSTLYYQRGGEEKLENIPMAAPKEGNLYQATIPGESITGNSVKYYIEVKDKFGNQTDSKDEVGEPYVIEIASVNNGGSNPWDPIKGWHKKWYVWVLIGVGAIITGIAISNSGGGQGGAGGGTGGGAGG